MKRAMMALIGLIMSINLYAAKCDSDEFKQISAQAVKMQKAWNNANLEKIVSFYADDFIYMSRGKAYTAKESVLKHYSDSFADVSDNNNKNLGKIILDYQYCKTIDANSQLVILKYTWTSSEGEKSSGKDLMIWQKDKKGNYKVTVDFPQ